MCHQGRTSKTTLFQSYTWLIECRFKPKRDLFASHFFKILFNYLITKVKKSLIMALLLFLLVIDPQNAQENFNQFVKLRYGQKKGS